MSDYADAQQAIAALESAVAAVEAENASLRAQLADATSGNSDTRLGDLAKHVHRHAGRLRQVVTDSSAISGGEAARLADTRADNGMTDDARERMRNSNPNQTRPDTLGTRPDAGNMQSEAERRAALSPKERKAEDDARQGAKGGNNGTTATA